MPINDTAAGPAGELAVALRRLHIQAGRPSMRVLAQRIGTVSHTTVADALAGRRTPSWSIVGDIVRELGGDKEEFKRLWLLTTGTGRESAGRREDAFVSSYLRQVAAFTSWLGLPEPTAHRRVAFDELYVLQRVVPFTAEDDAEVQDLWTLDDQLHRAVLLGDPGIGKSTACRALMHRHAVEWERPVPFLITVRDFSATIPPMRSVVGYLEHTAETFFQVRPSEGVVTRLLAEGRALVIFDGLDELTGAAARATASIIELFCVEFPRARVLVTARLVGYAQAQLDPGLFSAYRLLGFSQPQIADYVHRWFAVATDLPDPERQRFAESFLAARTQIADIESNPLLLAFTSQLYAIEGRVPRNLTTLYSSLARLLLNQWDGIRGIAMAPPISDTLELALSHVAFRMLDDGVAQIAEHDLFTMLAEFLASMFSRPGEAASAARMILDYARTRAWMITEIGRTEYGDSLYQFSHLSFMEYFAAKHLVSIPDTARELARRLPHPQWHQVAEFVLELVEHGRDDVDEFLAALIEEIENLPPADRPQALDFVQRVQASSRP